jgi:hypothetical protein
MEDPNKSEIVKTLIEVFDEKLVKLTPKEGNEESALDIPQPKDWKEFVSKLSLTGVVKLLMDHCSVMAWNIPYIVLVVDCCQQPFLSEDRRKYVQDIFRKHYERKDLKVIMLLQEIDIPKGILEIIQEKVSLKKTAPHSYIGLCPFHKETQTPSFSVNVDKEFYHCFGCGVHGNAIDFIKEIKDQEIIDKILSGHDMEMSDEVFPAVQGAILNIMQENEIRVGSISNLSKYITENNRKLKLLLGFKEKEEDLDSPF